MRSRSLVLLITAVTSVAALGHPRDLTQVQDDWATINDLGASVEQRLAAEQRLMAVEDPQAIPYVFEHFFDPIGQHSNSNSVLGLMSFHPGLGSLEMDAELLPVEAQIAYARMRIWKHLVRHAQPDEERQRVLVELLDDVYADWTDRTHRSWELELILECLGDLSIHDRGHGNWSDAIESRVQMLFLSDGIYADRARGMLMFNAHDVEEFSRYFQHAMDEAWAKRGTPEADWLAGSLSGKFFRFGRQYDPRLLILMLERIDHAREGDDTGAVYAAVKGLAVYLELDSEWSPPFKHNGGEFENGTPEWIGAYIENAMAWVREHRADMVAGRFKPEWVEQQDADDR